MEVRDHNDKLLREQQGDLKTLLADAKGELEKEEVGSVTIRKRKQGKPGNQASELQKNSRKL